ncbi:MAG: saccharopine dehydrogenase NADP-binding domain-containing protein [Deltaproteobacteria bacterium]|nr:saccharopine dehydrogenase NADP-binding domain-containing protein [Deltaproteobacteria bacterium]
MGSARTYDLILFGATGFTGRLVAEYLLGTGTGIKWALGGRSAAKLEEVKRALAVEHPAAAVLPVVVADSLDEAAMARVAADCKVVCTTVGPYDRYGEPLVAACARAGTHYCDLTGEPQFVRRMIDRYEAAAKESGARIVHCCGYDSIPSDLGSMMVAEAMVAQGAAVKEVRAFAGESKGTFSGGTVASMINILEEVRKDPSLRKVLGHPYGLNPEGQRKGPDRSDQSGIRFDDALGMWTAPFVMASINTRVVRRSHALRGFPYGQDFRYSECMSTGKGMQGWLRAAAITGGLGGFMAAMAVGPARKLLAARVLPKPGEGPSKEARESGYFVFRHLAFGERPDGTQVQLLGKVRGNKDPGYGETAKMLGESALCLAEDEAKLPVQGGIWTPATAMGQVLLDRLRAAGMTFEVGPA